MTPARLLYDLRECPDLGARERYRSHDVGRCYMCGLDCEPYGGVETRRAYSGEYSDWDCGREKLGTHVCAACVWATGGRPPDTYRMWTVVYREDRPPAPSNPKAHAGRLTEHLSLTGKENLLPALELLLAPPETGRYFCALADSGKIHTLPWAPVCEGPRWHVRLERHDVAATPRMLAELLSRTHELYEGGYVLEDIRTGEPHPSKLVKHGIDLWRRNDAVLSPVRGSSLFELALFLTRRSLTDETRRLIRPLVGRGDGAGGDVARPRDDALRIDRENQPNELVAASQERTRDRRSHGDNLQDNDFEHGAKAPNRCDGAQHKQGDLFAWGSAR